MVDLGTSHGRLRTGIVSNNGDQNVQDGHNVMTRMICPHSTQRHREHPLTKSTRATVKNKHVCENISAISKQWLWTIHHKAFRDQSIYIFADFSSQRASNDKLIMLTFY
jgi:hypothetical protein